MSVIGGARLAFLRGLAVEQIINRDLYGQAGRKPERRERSIASALHSDATLRVCSLANSYDEECSQLTEALAGHGKALASRLEWPSGGALPVPAFWTPTLHPQSHSTTRRRSVRCRRAGGHRASGCANTLRSPGTPSIRTYSVF